MTMELSADRMSKYNILYIYNLICIWERDQLKKSTGHFLVMMNVLAFSSSQADDRFKLVTPLKKTLMTFLKKTRMSAQTQKTYDQIHPKTGATEMLV